MIKNLPQGWRVEKLGNLCNIATGKRDANFGTLDGQYLFFTCAAKPIKSDSYSFDGESIILAGNGANVGLVLYYDGKFEAYQRTYVLNNFNENSRYIYYNLQKYWIFHNSGKQFGSATNYIKMENITDYPIVIPPLPQQEKIVKVLDKSASLVEQQKQLIETYDVFLKSKFIEMFGDPITNPMGWEVKKLKEITTLISSGSTPKGGSQVYVEKGILFFRSQNVWKNKILLDDIAYIDNETHLKMKKSSLKHKDILITKTGRFNTENSSLGRAALFLGADNSANINGHVYLVRLKKSMAHEFVTYILTTNEYREYIRSVCVGGIDKRQINKIHLEEFPIIFPPIELQKEFSLIVEKIEAIKEKETQKLNHLETLHVSLMDKAFKGEIA